MAQECYYPMGPWVTNGLHHGSLPVLYSSEVRTNAHKILFLHKITWQELKIRQFQLVPVENEAWLARELGEKLHDR
jgi:hypothetical protein